MKKSTDNIEQDYIDFQLSRLSTELEKSKALISNQERTIDDLIKKNKEIVNSTFWSSTSFIRWLLDYFRKNELKHISYADWKKLKKETGLLKSKPNYKAYRKYLHGTSIRFADSFVSLDELKKQDFDNGPIISLAVPLYNTDKLYLEELIDSTLSQTYKKWQLFLGDASDSDHAYVKAIVQKYMTQDNRIHYIKIDKNEGISENTNKILSEITGDYISLIDHDDLIHPCALSYVVREIEKGADFIYSDELIFREDDLHEISVLQYKPDFDWFSFLSSNYICHLSVFSYKLLESAGKKEFTEFDGAQDYDLFLRLIEKAQHVVHIPKILYFWRSHQGSTALSIDMKPEAISAGKRAIEEHLKRMNIDGVVSPIEKYCIYKINYEIKQKPLVSIIIPNKDQPVLLYQCISSIVQKSSWDNYEINVIDNNSTLPDIEQSYEIIKKIDDRVHIYHYDGSYNYSRINNFGVTKSQGDILLFLNNDTKILSPNWIEEMLMLAQQKKVGAVGACLFLSNGDMQSAGISAGSNGIFNCGTLLDFDDAAGRANFVRSVAAVTGACLMLRRELYDEIHGFDPALAVEFNDVDLCLSLSNKGYVNVYTPFAKLYHYESISRNIGNWDHLGSAWMEMQYIHNKWPDVFLKPDPYYNPNFRKGDCNWDPVSPFDI
jgi:GT2 family glycosyltransferase